MLANWNHRLVVALLLAGSLVGVGCDDDLMGPTRAEVTVSRARTPRVETVGPEIVPPPADKHLDRDLAIARVEPGASGRITVVVRNNGPSHFYGPFEVALYREYGEFDMLLQTVRWGDGQTLLPPGALVTLVIRRESCGGSMRYRVVVDPNDDVYESNEENNRSRMFFSWGCS